MKAEVLERLNNLFSWDVASISASSTDYYNFTGNKQPLETDDAGQETQDYAPFRNIVIYNNGTTDLRIYFNRQQGYRILPAGTILELTGQSISQLDVQNTSGASAGSYTFTLDNDVKEINILRALITNQ